jgi:hypothetical protein
MCDDQGFAIYIDPAHLGHESESIA